MSDQIKHAANLLVLAFVQNNFVPGVVFSLTDAANFCRSGARTVVQRDSATQSLDRLLLGKSLHLRFVDFLHFVSSGGNEVREVSIVRQQQKSFSIEIQTAHRIQPSERGRQEFDNGWASLGIANAREVTLRLVQQDINFFPALNRRINEFAANFDVIGLRIRLGAELGYYLAVDRNSAGSN